jgi:acetyl-CoA carboxylase carboxyl transferase subunit beta
MSILDWFEKRERSQQQSEKLNIPGDLWVKCLHCAEILFIKDLEENLKVCSKCEYHFRISPQERLCYLFDQDSFLETENTLQPLDFLGFVDTESYEFRIHKASKKGPNSEAVLTGTATLLGTAVNVGIMDFSYMGGSMGSVVGEKLTRLIELALNNKNPLLIFTSSGGARMQEGILSLMQMAKTSSALSLLSDSKIPYISILCDPTTGGTSASFAMLGDIHIAEPGALISFAGPRVIEQTIRQKLPPGFQRAEFLLKHGMVDMVTPRYMLKETLSFLLKALLKKD